MNILLFGGTTEGRVLCEVLCAGGALVTVCVATELGAEELRQQPGLTIRIGRLDQAGMQALLPGFDLCIDATHPYAVEVTANIRAACLAMGVPLRRLLRPQSADTQDAIQVSSCTEAAAFLAQRTGNILIATGAKELPAFSALDPARLYARVLPTHAGISACEALGLAHRNILALQGPFTQAMNEAMLVQYRIAWMVTKDGGTAGGFAEKLHAAQNTGARLILVGRPPEEGCTMEQLLQEIGGLLA